MILERLLRRPFMCFAVACISLILGSTLLCAADVPRWMPYAIAFRASAAAGNPLMVSLSATVTGPDGSRFVLPGFYDGDGVWKIRVSPTAEGQWSLVTKSEFKELDSRSAAFECVKSTPQGRR